MSTQPPETPAAQGTAPRLHRTKRERARRAGAVVLGVVAVLFAVLNLDEVKVNWIVATWSTPLILVIVVSVLLGMLIDRVLLHRSRHRR